ncbi:MAG: SBBP repeat-containing protein, partial [Calditrichaeota bacterium]|nr:SBBP repeat-containing protein [Calditrichota bacterium]
MSIKLHSGRQTRGKGEAKQLGSTNYFKGGETSQWYTGVPGYARVRYEDVYPNIDIVYYGKNQQVEYDFIVKPNANPEDIVFSINGAENVVIDPNGDLNLLTPSGLLCFNRPVAYQEIGGQRQNIYAGYTLNHDLVGFELGDYNREFELVIDPIIEYSTYLGGNGTDEAYDIAVDKQGNAYIVGKTSSTNFHTSTSAFDTVGRKGGFFDDADVFVAKLDPSGSTLIYGTYLSGGGTDIGLSIAVDAGGNVYITGKTDSEDDAGTVGVDERYPIKNAFQPNPGGNGDLFVTKLNADGSDLIYSTYLGGTMQDDTDQDQPAIGIDPAGNAYIAGTTQSTDFPTTAGVFDTQGPGPFVAKLNSAGSALDYSTFLGGDDFVFVWGLDVDSGGRAVVTGFTGNPNLPTTPGSYQPVKNDKEDAFIYKLKPDGSGFDFCTYVGGSSDDFGYGLSIDRQDNVYITGNTTSSDFPVTVGSIPLNGGAFATKLTSDGSSVVYSVPLGGDFGYDIGTDVTGRAFVTGEAIAAIPDRDVFFTQIAANGSGIEHETFWGGLFRDIGYGLAVSDSGKVYVAGVTSSSSFPGDEVRNQNPLQASLSSPPDAFVVKFDPEVPITSPFITRKQAINLVLTQVIHPTSKSISSAVTDSDSLVAFLYNRTGNDSLLQAGDTVFPADSMTFFHEVASPSYFFWLDRGPDKEWLHPTTFVFVDAMTSELTTFDAVSWPVINEAEYLEFTENGNESPNGFYGKYGSVAPRFEYDLEAAGNKQDWAVIVVSRNVSGDREKRARVNDIARIHEILNGADKGPKIHPDNIITVPGADTLGATDQEFCDALEALKGKACRKLYFFYLGHGKNKFMLLRGNDKVSYNKLATKLKKLSAEEFCIVIEACYSEHALSRLRGIRKLKGIVVTSSPKRQTTTRISSGAPFYIGLNQCFKDDNADLNEDGKITILEALAWAAATNDQVAEDGPRGSTLLGSKKRKIEFLPNQIVHIFEGLRFELVCACYKIKKSPPICKKTLYVENHRTRENNAGALEVWCLNKRGKRVGQAKKITVNLPGRRRDKIPRLCFSDIPDDCVDFEVVRKGGGPRSRATVATIGQISQPLEYDPGEYIFEPIILNFQDRHNYLASIDGPVEWGLSIDPEQFVTSTVLDSEVVFIRGNLPQNIDAGGSFTA